MKKKTGILGGTFDPIHNGHLLLAESAYEQIDLDAVLLMPSPDPPHKQGRNITAFSHRANMVKLAIEEKEGLLFSDYENTLDQPSYTARTLQSLTDSFPDQDFYFILGEDSLNDLETWYHPEDVLRLATLVVAVRRDPRKHPEIHVRSAELEEKYGAKICILQTKPVDVSSTAIRQAVAMGESIENMVPEKVAEYIWKENLYRN